MAYSGTQMFWFRDPEDLTQGIRGFGSGTQRVWHTQRLRGCGILRDSDVLVQGLRGFDSGNQRVWFRDSEGVAYSGTQMI